MGLLPLGRSTQSAMGSTAASLTCSASISLPFDRVLFDCTSRRDSSSPSFLKPSAIRSLAPLLSGDFNPPQLHIPRFHGGRRCAGLHEREPNSTSPVNSQEEQPREGVQESVEILKSAAKTRRIAAAEVLSALSAIERARVDPSGFLDTLGGPESPGRTWMLVFTAKKQLKGGSYFPLTAVQRFDAAARRIENGVYLGPLGCITFEGRFSWNKRILAFIFELIRIKIGPLNPLEIGFSAKETVEPKNTKDPFFIWFYVDEEIAVARGRSGGTAFWCRCHRVSAT